MRAVPCRIGWARPTQHLAQPERLLDQLALPRGLGRSGRLTKSRQSRNMHAAAPLRSVDSQQ
jgi:hypothetical protein